MTKTSDIFDSGHFIGLSQVSSGNVERWEWEIIRSTNK